MIRIAAQFISIPSAAPTTITRKRRDMPSAKACFQRVDKLVIRNRNMPKACPYVTIHYRHRSLSA